MKLTKSQKKILATIQDKKFRKNKKKQFKLDNELLENIKKSNVYIVNWDLLGSTEFTRKINLIAFEKINGKGIPWFQKTAEEVDEKWDKAMAESQFKPENCRNKPETPKEFCVVITEENKEFLNKLWIDFHKERAGELLFGNYLHSSNKFDFLYSSNNITNNNKFVMCVSTEEFLRYIGKEDVILSLTRTINLPHYSSVTHKNPDESGKPHKYLADEVGQFNFNPNKDYFKPIRFSTHEPKINHSLGEIADKVAELALEKIDKTPDVKPLEFDLPKKEDFNVKDYLCFDLEELFYRVNSGEITIMNLYNILREKKLNENKKSPN